jgi:alkylation response protein AidB-like acyl-CoA dehydrogenase
MDFEPGKREAEVGAIVEAELAARADAANAMEAADAGALRSTLLDVQAAVAGAGVDLAGGEGTAWAADLATCLPLARASTSLFLAVSATRQCATLLASRGLLPAPLAAEFRRGSVVGAVASSEPAGTEAPASLSGTPWTLAGRKSFVTNGPIADVFAVTARTPEGEALCRVAASRPGVTAGARIATVGLNGLAVSDMDLSGVDVDVDQVADGRAEPSPRARYALDADLTLSFAAVGLMQRVLQAAKAHAAGHKRGGRAIAKHQEVGFKLAEMLTVTHAAELLARRAAWMVALSGPEAATLVRCARVFCAEGAERVASGAMQVAAGEGFVAGNPIERAWRDAKGLAFAGTTVEVARLSIADGLLERY